MSFIENNFDPGKISNVLSENLVTCIKVSIQIKFFGNNKTQAVAARFVSTKDCINNFCFQTGKFTRLSLSSLNKSTFPSDFKTQDRFKSSICRLAASSSPVSNKSLDDFKESAHIFICRRRARVAVECAYLFWEKPLKQYGAQ